MECLFCKIINKEIASRIVYENDEVLAFHDIKPKAPVHILVISKEHIESVRSNGSEQIVAKLVAAAKEIAKEQGIDGYKLSFNVGREGGQEVDHLHMHLLVGKPVDSL